MYGTPEQKKLYADVIVGGGFGAFALTEADAGSDAAACPTTASLVFDNVRIPADHLLGKEGEGFKIVMQTLDLARPLVGAAAVGVAQRALDESVKYAKERICFGILYDLSLSFFSICLHPLKHGRKRDFRTAFFI